MSTPDATAVDPVPSATGRYTSRAEVTTDAPGRYAKQLISHLGRKVPFTQDGNSWAADIQGATARITPGDGVLVLQAEAPDTELLTRIEHALGSHLERFGQRNQLTVTWQRATATA